MQITYCSLLVAILTYVRTSISSRAYLAANVFVLVFFFYSTLLKSSDTDAVSNFPEIAPYNGHGGPDWNKRFVIGRMYLVSNYCASFQKTAAGISTA